MIILVDMDGPLADFEEGFLIKWKEKYPKLPFIKKQDRKTFYLKDQYPAELFDKVQSIYLEPGFIENLPVVSGALDFIRDVEKLGHTVFICSSPLSAYGSNVLEKYKWVERYLGRDFIKRIILTKDKTLIKGDFLIDDKPSIMGKTMSTWKQVIFDFSSNRFITNLPRIKADWSNWKEVLIL